MDEVAFEDAVLVGDGGNDAGEVELEFVDQEEGAEVGEGGVG